MKSKILKLGIIGGGQLGMFLAKAAKDNNIEPYVYSNTKNAPAEKYTKKIFYGSFDDKSKLTSFSNKVDIITYEFENISISSLVEIQKRKIIFPPISALSIAQNRAKEKMFFQKNKIKHAKSFFLNSRQDLDNIKSSLRFPVILKTTRFGYDGKGQSVAKNYNDLIKSWKNLNFVPCIIEKKIKLQKELSVVCARDQNRNIFCFPVFRNIHKNHILFETFSPSGVERKLENKLIKISKKILNKLSYVGVLTIEFFIDQQGKIYANELAPRVHNSGHITLDNTKNSQFDQHIRAICGLDLIKSNVVKKGVMRNLLGQDIKNIKKISKESKYKHFKRVLVYSYNKKEVREGRKMGHLNFIKE